MEKFDKPELLRKWYINSSIGVSAVRNQGAGVIYPIRNILMDEFLPDEFFRALKAKKASSFTKYLNKLTKRIAGKRGYREYGQDRRREYTGNRVKWGTARKCINLVLRKAAYAGYLWEEHEITSDEFNSTSYLNRLEIPLDSFAFREIKKRCNKLEIPYDEHIFANITISELTPAVGWYIQELAAEIGRRMNICRIDLDLLFWRSNEEDEQ